jgi:hypothetical protein
VEHGCGEVGEAPHGVVDTPEPQGKGAWISTCHLCILTRNHKSPAHPKSSTPSEQRRQYKEGIFVSRCCTYHV